MFTLHSILPWNKLTYLLKERYTLQRILFLPYEKVAILLRSKKIFLGFHSIEGKHIFAWGSKLGRSDSEKIQNIRMIVCSWSRRVYGKRRKIWLPNKRKGKLITSDLNPIDAKEKKNLNQPYFKSFVYSEVRWKSQ